MRPALPALVGGALLLSVTACAAPASSVAGFNDWPAEVPFPEGTPVERTGFTNGCVSPPSEDRTFCAISLEYDAALVSRLRATYVDAGFAEVEQIENFWDYTRGDYVVQITINFLDNPGADLVNVTLGY